jgi:low affinity Fe/Cu permease
MPGRQYSGKNVGYAVAMVIVFIALLIALYIKKIYPQTSEKFFILYAVVSLVIALFVMVFLIIKIENKNSKEELPID